MDDHWRKALSRRYELEYVSLAFSGVRCLHDDQIRFSPGVTAIVGSNGVGKSTLAHAIIDVLSGDEGVVALQENEGRLHGVSLKAVVRDKSGLLDVVLEASSAGRKATGDIGDHGFTWIDPSTMALQCQNQLLGDEAFREVLEGVGQRELTKSELDSASYVVGKQYESCTVSEIRDYGPFEAWPYFSVKWNGVTYGSEDMGRGELALLIALWALASVPKNSVLILEEPETHVSARSQSALADLLGWACAIRGLWIVITTHSPIMLKRLPKEHIRLLVPDGPKSRLIHAPHLHEIAALVGGGVAYKSLLLVEDACAQSFLHELLDLYDPDLRRQCQTVAMGGEARISTILETLPRAAGWMQVVGCYDGDMRDRVDRQSLKWPIAFLPGGESPELLLRSHVISHSALRLADELRIGERAVTVALRAAEGKDPHDWRTVLSGELNRHPDEVTRAMVRMWVSANDGAAREVVAQLQQAVGS